MSAAQPGNFLETLPLCDCDVFPDVRELLLIGATSPIGSCEAERSFSALRSIKTHLRANMGQERLTGVTMMAVHYSDTQKLDTEAIIKSYMQANPTHYKQRT